MVLITMFAAGQSRAWKEAIFEQFSTVLELQNHKTFCINDVGLQAERKTEVNSAVTDFLETYFPTPSSFER